VLIEQRISIYRPSLAFYFASYHIRDESLHQLLHCDHVDVGGVVRACCGFSQTTASTASQAAAIAAAVRFDGVAILDSVNFHSAGGVVDVEGASGAAKGAHPHLTAFTTIDSSFAGADINRAVSVTRRLWSWSWSWSTIATVASFLITVALISREIFAV
jgi:hypothetical protein